MGFRPSLKLGLGKGGGRPVNIQFLHNGFTAPDTLTSGALYVADNLGVLRTAGVDKVAIPGARLSGSDFVLDDGAGNPLFTSASVRTKSQGSVTQYTDAAWQGMLVMPARTNKVTCRKVNPVDTTNVTKTGDAVAVLSVVDDTVALTAAGLIGICTSGKAYKLDNSGGTGDSFAACSPQAGNTNSHSLGIYARVQSGSCILRFNLADRASTTSTSYVRLTANNVATGTTSLLTVKAPAGSVVYFILPELIEAAFLTDSPAVPPPTVTDALASYTRAATVPSFASANRLRSQNCAVWGKVIPSAASQGGSPHVFSSYTDSNNQLQVHWLNDTLKLINMVAGSSAGLTSVTYTYDTNVPFEYQAFWSNQGRAIRVKQSGGAWGSWSTSADATEAQIASTFQVGSQNGANQFAASYPWCGALFLPTLASLAEYQAYVETDTKWSSIGG